MKSERENTTTWQHHWSVGRLKLSYRIHRHRSHNPELSDRWVFQPDFVYDRKRPSPQIETLTLGSEE